LNSHVPEWMMKKLCTPDNHYPLIQADGKLLDVYGERAFSAKNSILHVSGNFISNAGNDQQAHYDSVSSGYMANLSYPHTKQYMEYLDRQIFLNIGKDSLGDTIELCCGQGEALKLLEDKISHGVGVDVSESMLKEALINLTNEKFYFVQGDATILPFLPETFDTVVMLGGVHHIPDRAALFSEIYRILKPGGMFLFREPVDDFLLWRIIRKIVYRLSSALDHINERPLRYLDTKKSLSEAGLKLLKWRTMGFFGFCLFMNSDILIVNRLFRFIPFIHRLVNIMTKIDELVISLPCMRNNGLQVIGIAIKNERN